MGRGTDLADGFDYGSNLTADLGNFAVHESNPRLDLWDSSVLRFHLGLDPRDDVSQRSRIGLDRGRRGE